MAKWIYERWSIKWDVSNPDYLTSAIASTVYPIDIATLQASETGVTVMGAPGMVFSSATRRDDYRAGVLADCQYGLPGQRSPGGIPQFRITQPTLAQRRIKDARLADVILEEGTVPDDGIHMDGYWYVKVKRAFPMLKIGGYTAVEGQVMIDGQLRTITDAEVVIDSVLRKSV